LSTEPQKDKILQAIPLSFSTSLYKFFSYAQDREMTTLSRDREMSRDQSSVPNFASLMAKEELEDASCYYPASGRRSLGNLNG
jgi:hypothetical protein